MIYLIIVIILLVGVNIFLSLLIYFWTKKFKPIEDKDKEFIIFVIDMYIQYAKDLDIHSEDQHEKMVKYLSHIKQKYFEDKH